MLKKIIPQIELNLKKGQNGRGGVIGGSFEYTGAPFYTAISLLKSGCDLSHIFCHKVYKLQKKDAGNAIKSYSPEVIVHPLLKYELDEQMQESVNQIIIWCKALDSLVIGPGLGRNQILGKYISEFIKQPKNLIIILDADFFWYLSEFNQNQQSRIQLLDCIQKSENQLILTPNVVEFQRLYKQFLPQFQSTSQEQIQKEIQKIISEDWNYKEVHCNHLLVKDCVDLSQFFQNKIIIQKGQIDIITNGEQTFLVKNQSGLKRCGGQGDILSGCLATYAFWGNQNDQILYGCIMASMVTRQASYLAYQKEQWSLTAPEIINQIGNSFKSLF